MIIPFRSVYWGRCNVSHVLHCRFMAYECLRVGAEDLRILVSSEMVRVFSVGASGMCTTVVETHLRYIVTPFNITWRWWLSWAESSSIQNPQFHFPIANILILHMNWFCYCCTVLFLWRTCYVSTASVVLKFVIHTFRVLCHQHVCNHWLTSSV
jgi:hypothetical protein